MRLRAALIAVALALASTASAQNLRSLPLATSTTGGNDALLTLVSDSAYRTRAMTLVQFRKALSVTAFDSLITTKLNLTGATITGAPTWSSLQTFAAGQRVDSATGAARSQILTTARALWGQNFDGSAAITGSLTSVGNITGGASNMTIQAGTGNNRTITLQTTNAGGTPVTAFTCDPISGFCNTGQATLYVGGVNDASITRNGNNDVSLQAGASGHGILDVTDALTLTGGAGNMTITAGVGNSRTLALRTTTSGGTATTFLTGNPDQSAYFASRAKFGIGSAVAPSISYGDTTSGPYRFGVDTLGWATLGVHSLRLSGGASATLAGGAGNMVILAGTGNSRTMTLQSTNSSGTATTFLTGSVAQAQAANGTAALPSWTFANSSTTGLYRFGADTIGVAIAGANALQIPALGSIVGGAGNMTLTAGTGNSRTMTLQTTTSAGTAKNTLVLGADTSATFLGAGTFAGALTSGALTATTATLSDAVTSTKVGQVLGATGTSTSARFVDLGNTSGNTRLLVEASAGGTTISGSSAYASILAATSNTALELASNSSVRLSISNAGVFNFSGNLLPSVDNNNDLGSASKRWSELYVNPAASGVGDTYVCLSTGQQVHAGATCAASTLKMKDSVVAYTNADAILKLRPVTFNFKAGYYGQRAEIGLIAEEAALVDSRFVFVATKFDTLSKIAPTIALNALTQKLDTTAVVIKPGEPEALNVSSIVAALVAQVQVQKRQLDSLSAVVFTLQQKAP